jgi:mannosyltransferase
MNPEVIITNLHKRYTGVSGTINALLPVQARTLKIGFVGTDLPGFHLAKSEHPDNIHHMSVWEAIRISRKPLPDGRPRIWHVRRDPEMMLAIFLRDVLGCPIRIVFTSAAQRRHSWLPRWLISRMDSVIATTPEAAKFVKSSAVIPHGVDVDHFKPPEDKLNAWKNTGLPGKYGVGIFGRVRPEKGTDVFVDAMLDVLPDFPEFTAVIVGLCQPQFESFRADLKQKIYKKNLSGRIFFIGEIPPEQVRDWYANLLITVACPRYEGYGLTLLEGMASGCAVVASETGIFRKVIAESRAGHLAPVGDYARVASGLRQLMISPVEACNLGQIGRKYVENCFSSGHESADIMMSYKKLWQGL